MGLKDYIFGLALLLFLLILILLITLRLLQVVEEWMERWGRVDFHFRACGNIYAGETILEARETGEDDVGGEYEIPISVGPLTIERFICSVFWYRFCHMLELFVLGIHWVAYQKYLDLRDLFMIFSLRDP